MCIHIAHCFIVICGIDLMFLQNGLEILSKIHELVKLFNNPPTTMRQQCTRNGKGWYWIHTILCIVGLYSIFSNPYHCLSYYISYSFHKKIWYLQQQTTSYNPDYKVIIPKSSWISYNLIHLFRKRRGITQSLRYILKECGK